jgi:hypothetical protein
MNEDNSNNSSKMPIKKLSSWNNKSKPLKEPNNLLLPKNKPCSKTKSRIFNSKFNPSKKKIQSNKNKPNKKTKNVWSSSEFSTNNKERVWKIITSKKKIKHKESSIKWSKNSNPNTKFKSKIWKKSSAFSRKTPCLLRKL